MLTLEVKSLSVHSFKNVCNTCQWKLNKIVWSKVHKILSFLKKNRGTKNHFWQNVDAILEDISVVETIV